ncbi:MAG TPA: FHA domain-containing protein, partial [Clostridiaceae bacterium]|nr:FHA domain-containing protein [Clostridiaceae bacterium]
CKITKVNNKFFIQDMGSLNGTYVNSIRLKENQKVQIKRGDIIKLSNINFIVK